MPSKWGPGVTWFGAQVLGEQQVADRVDRVAPGRPHQLAQRPALPLEVLRPGQAPSRSSSHARSAREQAPARPHLAADPVAHRRDRPAAP